MLLFTNKYILDIINMVGDDMFRKTYIEIDLDIIKSNVINIIKKYNDYQYYFGVVKGNAYGHGLEVITPMIEGGINYLAVSNLDEAIEVRNIYRDIPILCLEPIELDLIDECIKNNITITISSYDYFKDLQYFNFENLKVHLKIDTGMNRIGINDKKQIEEIYYKLVDNKKIQLEGIFSHFATPGLYDFRWKEQVDRFKLLTQNIDLNKIPIVHMGSSNSIVIHPKIDFCNGVRLGVVMYGVSPRKINFNGIKGKLRKIKYSYLWRKHNVKILDDFNLDVKDAFSFITEVMEIKEVKKNEYIGYGNTYKALEDMKIAVLPVGYADGINLGNTGRMVSINNRRYQIVGAISMGMITVKIDENVKLKDKVYLIGNGISIREIASYMKCTPHYITTSIPSSIPRVYRKR